jgi:EmrB/QacA subfamily drug resistance transporter
VPDLTLKRSTPATLAPPSTRLTALIVACALLMQNLDSTVVATALPQMARAFHADPLHMNVALTSYLISLAVFIPASGWMADRFGTRTVFRAAIAVFTLASVLCGRANTLPFLVFARVVQGVGGAMMVPVGRLVLLRSVAKADLVAAMAWISMPALIGPVLGPPVGGLIVTYASWRWIFDINVPIGVLGIVLVTLFVPNVREPRAARFDAWGLLFSGVALAGLLFGLETIGRGTLPMRISEAVLVLSAVSAAAYLMHARIHPHPVIDLTLFRIPSFMVSVLGGSLFRLGVGAMPYLLPLMLQLGFGQSAAHSGAITCASAAGAMVMKPAAQYTLRRFGFRSLLLVNGVLSAVALGLCAVFRATTPLALIYGVLLCGGLFRSLQFTAYNTVAFADVPSERMGSATSLYALMQQLTLTLGITAGAAALEVSVTAMGHATAQPADFSVAFIVVAAASLCAAPVSLLMSRTTGAEMSGHRSG